MSELNPVELSVITNAARISDANFSHGWPFTQREAEEALHHRNILLEHVAELTRQRDDAASELTHYRKIPIIAQHDAMKAEIADLTGKLDRARRIAAGEFPDKRHRDALVEVITHHHRSRIEGCGCGWSDLGRSHSEHVADVYELQCRRIAIEAGAFL